MAFGTISGQILLYKLEKPRTLLNSDIKKPYILEFEKRPIKRLIFTNFDNNMHLVYTTDDHIFCLENCKDKRKLD